MHNTELKPLAKRILWIMVAVAASLLTLHLLFQYLNLEVYQEKQGQVFELSNRLDVDDEVGLPTWLAQFNLLAIAGAAWLTARLEGGARRKAWLFIALAGLVMSIDEVGAIHEFVLQTAFLLYYGDIAPSGLVSAWWLALPVIVGAAGLLVWWLSRHLPRRTMKLFVVAGLVYLIGAVGLEVIGDGVDKRTFMHQGVMTGLEEAIELIGSSLALFAVIDYIETHHTETFGRLRRLLARKRS